MASFRSDEIPLWERGASHHSIPDEDSSMLYQSPDYSTVASTTGQHRRLRDQLYKRLSRASFDVCLAVIPCMFIYLAIAARLLDGQPESHYGRRVQEYARLGPTIYPIAFAAIIARFMRHIARWQAQRGQSLGILEQLIQSSSLGATVETAISLRATSLASLLIVSIWALSPIGGQSSLRVLSTRVTTISVDLIVPFGETMRYFGGLSQYALTPIVIQALISVSLGAPNSTTLSPRDTWDNVKVPAARYVQADGAEYAMAHQATAMNGVLENETEYSSLIGVPVWGIPQQGNLTFSFEWPVFDTDCQWTTNYTELEYCRTCDGGKTSCFVNQTILTSVYGWPRGCNVSEYVGLNYTDLQRCQLCEGGNSSCFAESRVNGTVDGWPEGCRLANKNLRLTAIDLQPIISPSSPSYVNLDWYVYVPGSMDDAIYSTGASCKLRTTQVTVDVFCADGICEAIKTRKSLLDSRPDFVNPWNDASVGQDVQDKKGMLDVFLEFLLASTGTTTNYYATPLQSWILGSPNPYEEPSLYSDAAPGWWNLSDTELSRRLTKLYNTMWLASQQSSDITARVPGRSFRNETTNSLLPSYRLITTTYTTPTPLYAANHVWIALLIAISLLLLLCALTSLALRLLITAPDILGYVSSLTRDNVHFPRTSLGPGPLRGASIMSGSDRARALRDVRVQIVDLCPEKDVGHVAVVPVEVDVAGVGGGRRVVGRVERGRVYD